MKVLFIGDVVGSPGRKALSAIVPTFGPKRLFNPDASARQDTRTLDVLCTPTAANLPLYPGQRVTARVFVQPVTPVVAGAEVAARR